eukprot:153126-Prymnesium_polylepis.1
MLGGGAGGGPRPEPRSLTATCWPVRVLGLNTLTYGGRNLAGFAQSEMRLHARVASRTTSRTVRSRKTSPPTELVLTLPPAARGRG